MTLNLAQIQQITTGAADVKWEEGAFWFYRFGEEQMEMYRQRSQEFYLKAHCPSGVQLRFRTNSENLGLKTVVSRGCTRDYYAVEVFVNGKELDALDNFRNERLPQNYTVEKYTLEPREAVFALGAGEKEVRILLPWAVKLGLREVSLDDGATLVPAIPERKILCFGDSITQGYDAMYPSHKYVTRFAEYLGAAEYNKAIGGEIFYPELAAVKEKFDPDYILVAYGTNDWSKCEREVLVDNCTRFYEAVCNTYPNAKVFALTPIWRKASDTPKRGMEFSFVAELIRSATEKFENVTVIQGDALVDADVNLYADLRLHPNDAGFICYADRLIEAVKKG